MMPQKPSKTPPYKAAEKSMIWQAHANDLDMRIQRYSKEYLERFRIISDEFGRAVSAKDGRTVFDTSRYSKAFSNFECMYVMDSSGNFYICPRLKNKFHHSSLVAKDTNPVAAGVIIIEDGLIVYLDEESGHYRFKNHLFLATYELRRQGFLIPQNAVLKRSTHKRTLPDQRYKHIEKNETPNENDQMRKFIQGDFAGLFK